MQPIVTSLPSSIPASNPLSPDSTPFDSSPHSPTSATTTSDLSSSHHANRPAGQHNLRGIKAVVEEERLYQWRDSASTANMRQAAEAEEDGVAGGGRVKGAGVGSTLWQRRQQQVNRQQQSRQQHADDSSTT